MSESKGKYVYCENCEYFLINFIRWWFNVSCLWYGLGWKMCFDLVFMVIELCYKVFICVIGFFFCVCMCLGLLWIWMMGCFGIGVRV